LFKPHEDNTSQVLTFGGVQNISTTQKGLLSHERIPIIRPEPAVSGARQFPDVAVSWQPEF
jgi:hypothetical protein